MVTAVVAAFNAVGDRVFVRDEHYAWLPATVLELEDDRALVRIDWPSDWNETTVLVKQSHPEVEATGNAHERWVPLREYFNHQLPLQNNNGSTSYRDLAELPYLHEASVLYQLKERHCRQLPYTRGGDILVAVNPCQWIPGLYSREQQRRYHQLFGDASKDYPNVDRYEEKKEDSMLSVPSWARPVSPYDRFGCEPHIYEISSIAYRRVSFEHKNQAILVVGESGAGKTESAKIIFQHLASLRQEKVSAGGNSEDDLVQHLLQSSPIFEAFGNAKTLRNNNSSRFGKVTKLQYFAETNGASLVGSSFNTYMLETSRVVSQAEGERNFHIFYQILSATEELKEELLGPDWGEATADDFRYLQSDAARQQLDVLDDATRWSHTWKAMEVFGWDRSILRDLMSALGSILLIGNVEFEDKEDYIGKATIANRPDLNMLAHTLGLHVDELEWELTNRLVQTSQEKVQMPYNTDQARAVRDAFAKAIYAGIFSTIVRQINLFTSTPSPNTDKLQTISLVDIFGFECFEKNRFEQFCINYAAERLQYKFVRDNFDRYSSEYEVDGIIVPDWREIDNTDTILLFEGKSGLIRTLNEQSVRQSGNNENFVFKAKSAHRGQESLIIEKSQLQTEFCVRHFAGTVLYDASSFVKRNVERLPDTLLTVATHTSNMLIQQEFAWLLRAREVCGSSSELKKKSGQKTVIQKFCKDLRDMLISVDSTEALYVRCIRPCDELTHQERIDHQTVLRQIRYSGLVTAVELSRDAFPDKLPFSTVELRFSCLVPAKTLRSIVDVEPHDKTQILMSAAFAQIIKNYRGSDFAMPFACGHTKVYFRAGALQQLEYLRDQRIRSAALRIQSFLLSSAKAITYRRLLKNIVLLQALSRRRPQIQAFDMKRKSAILIQAEVRRAIIQSNFLLMKESALVIVEWFRAVLLQLRYQRLRRAAQKLAAWSRMQIVHRRFLALLQVTTTIQAFARVREPRCRFLEKRCAQATISRWWKPILVRLQYIRLREAAAVVAVWYRSRSTRIRFIRLVRAVTMVQARSRSRRIARLYACDRENAKVITSWSRTILIRRRFKRIQTAGQLLTMWARSRIQRAIFIEAKTASTVLSSWYRARKGKARYQSIQKAAAIVRSRVRSRYMQHLRARKHAAAVTIQAAVRSKHRAKSSSLKEELEQYKRQVQELQGIISTVTAESALHMEEVEAEYEERLAEYEDEVLLMRQVIARHEEEKRSLKEELAANAENVTNLKTGIQSMQESHRDYLSKVMRAIEKANVDHAKALDMLKRDRDTRVNELTAELKMLKNGNDPATQKRNYDINRLARKLERLISPDYIVAMAEKASGNGLTTVECVEQKVSSKARTIIYRLEDKLSSSVAIFRDDAEKDRCIEKLQQQLVRAYEEIEAMQTGRGYESRIETEASRASRPAKVQKKGLRRVFYR